MTQFRGHVTTTRFPAIAARRYLRRLMLASSKGSKEAGTVLVGVACFSMTGQRHASRRLTDPSGKDLESTGLPEVLIRAQRITAA